MRSKHLLYLPIFLFYSYWGTSVIFGQKGHTFSLEQSIEYALVHNPDLQNLSFDAYIAEKQTKTQISIGYPQISLNADATYNFNLPQFVFPFNPDTGEPTPTTIELGVPGQFTTGAQLSQMVFDGVYFIGLKAARSFVRVSQKNLLVNQESIALAVTKAYYAAVISKEMEKLVEANLNRVEKLYYETKVLNENGFTEKIDVERLEINVNNLKLSLQKARRSSSLSLDALKFQLGMPVHDILILSEQIQDFQIIEEPSINPNTFTFRERIEYETLLERQTLLELDRKRLKATYLPSLYANANYGWNLLWDNSNSFNYRTSGVGLNLKFPIFDGFSRKNQVAEARLKLLKLDQDIKKLENGIVLEQRQAISRLEDSKDALTVSEKNTKLAKKVFNVATVKYKEGVGSSLELNDAENQLKTAELTYLQSLYEFLIAKADHNKAFGKFSKYQRNQ